MMQLCYRYFLSYRQAPWNLNHTKSLKFIPLTTKEKFFHVRKILLMLFKKNPAEPSAVEHFGMNPYPCIRKSEKKPPL